MAGAARKSRFLRLNEYRQHATVTVMRDLQEFDMSGLVAAGGAICGALYGDGNARCVTFLFAKYHPGMRRLQVILRLFSTVSEVLHCFDLGSSAVADDGKQLYYMRTN